MQEHADVVLRDGDALGKAETRLSVFHAQVLLQPTAAHACGFGSRQNRPVGREDVAVEHDGERVHEAAPADAQRLLATDDARHELPVHIAHLVDGPLIRGGAVLDARALEHRARGGRAGEDPMLVAQHHLAVRAEVEEQRELIRTRHVDGEQAAGDVPADRARNARREVRGARRDVAVDKREVVNLFAEQRRRHVRSHAQRRRVDVCRDELHGGVSADGDVVDVRRRDAGLGRERARHLGEHFFEQLCHGLELAPDARLDALGDGGAKDELGVGAAHRVDQLAGLLVVQAADDGGRPHVDGKTVAPPLPIGAPDGGEPAGRLADVARALATSMPSVTGVWHARV